MSNTVLYVLWGVLYALCAALGFVTEPKNSLRLLMTVLSVGMFVPPFVLSYRASRKKDRPTLKLIRNLSGGWLVLTVALLVANLLSALSSETLGNILYSLLTMVSSPLVCCGSWALAIFLWACVFFDSLSKLNKK